MRVLFAAALVAALALAPACGGSSGGGQKPAEPIQTAPPARPAGTKFTIDYFSPGFAPVQVEVLRAGSGKLAKIGAEVQMHYVARAVGQEPYASSRQAGSSPKDAVVGVGQMGIVPGWDAAAVHMREGDLWKLTIPAELGYGDKGGPKVPPNSVLEIEVEMVSVK